MSDPDAKKRQSISAMQGADEARRARMPVTLPPASCDPNQPEAVDGEFAAACDASNFSPLKPAAALAIATAIRTRDETCATELNARHHFGWQLSLEIQRMVINGGTPGTLQRHGLSSRVAGNIAKAANLGHARFKAALEAAAAPGHNTGRRFAHKNYRTELEGLS
jgi:hypothetical protein